MEQNFAKLMVKSLIQPAGLGWFNPHRPMNSGEALIV